MWVARSRLFMSYYSWRKIRIDIAICCFLVLIGFSTSIYLGEKHFAYVADASTGDVWFDADPLRTMRDLRSRNAYDGRALYHPLFRIVVYPLVELVDISTGMSRCDSIRLIMAAFAGLWVLSVYFVLRLIDVRPWQAALLSILGITSSAGLFWLWVPELFVISSISLLVPIAILAIHRYLNISIMWYVFGAVISAAFLVTNIASSFFATLIKFGPQKAAKIWILALMILTLFFVIQREIFNPASPFPSKDSSYIFFPTTLRIGEVLEGLFINTMIAPDIKSYLNVSHDYKKQITFQGVHVMLSSPLVLVVSVFWLFLLVVGFYGLVKRMKNEYVAKAVGLTLVSQLILYLVYGEQTFLYAINFLPLLLIVSSYGFRHLKAHYLAIVMASLILLGLQNNYSKLMEAQRVLVSSYEIENAELIELSNSVSHPVK